MCEKNGLFSRIHTHKQAVSVCVGTNSRLGEGESGTCAGFPSGPVNTEALRKVRGSELGSGRMPRSGRNARDNTGATRNTMADSSDSSYDST